MENALIESLAVHHHSKIIFIIMDGLGGLPDVSSGQTELETAHTPHLDELAKSSICGLLDPVGFGITPGSGPAHLALFGYDPIRYNIGRGMLEAAGIDFPMTPRDLCIRINFATIDKSGSIIDRRAGRIDTRECERICRKLQDNISLGAQVQVFFSPVKEHRALLVLRGENLREELAETDPQKTGNPALLPQALIPEAKGTEVLLSNLINQSMSVLSSEKQANMILLRGYARHRGFPSMEERYKLRSLAIASYPMYRGIARLLGMQVCSEVSSLEEEISTLTEHYQKFDFFFVHVKQTDSRGEDGKFAEKVAVIESVDRLIPRVTALQPDVLVVTGDHSTPAALSAHSWHPVPVVLSARTCRPDRATKFGERECIGGEIGRIPMVNLMALSLAHAGRLTKFGA